MIQTTKINALCCGEKPPAVMQSFTSSVTPRIGFFDTVNPALIISSAKQKQRVNKLPALINGYAPDCSVIGLADMTIKADVKNRNERLIGTFER